MGEPPGWYLTIKAAQYLKVAPWDLERQPITWRMRAQAAMAAEAKAEREAEAAKTRGTRRG